MSSNLPEVSRKLFFDDEYTDEDLERDLRKSQNLPFAILGKPSPYRAPPRSNPTVIKLIKKTVSSTSFSDNPSVGSSTSAQSSFKNTTSIAPPRTPPTEELDDDIEKIGLRTPTYEDLAILAQQKDKKGNAKPKPLLGASSHHIQEDSFENDSQEFDFSENEPLSMMTEKSSKVEQTNSQQELADSISVQMTSSKPATHQASNRVSTGPSTNSVSSIATAKNSTAAKVKIVPSRYMQAIAKQKVNQNGNSQFDQENKSRNVPIGAKSTKKSGQQTHARRPLSDQLSIPSAKKTNPTSSKMSSNQMIDPGKRRMTVAASSTKKPAPLLGNTRISIGQTSNISKSSSSQGISTVHQASIPATPSTLDREELMRRRNSRLMKSAIKTSHQDSNEQNGACLHINDSINMANADEEFHISSQEEIQNVDELASSQGLSKSHSNIQQQHRLQPKSLIEGKSKFVASRYMQSVTSSTKKSSSAAQHMQQQQDYPINSSRHSIALQSPQVKKTPGPGLKKGHSTSSLQVAKTPSSTLTVSVPDLKELSQTLEMPKIVTSSAINKEDQHRKSIASTQGTTSTTTAPNTKSINIQQVQLETQLMQTQLLQWHYINHKLQQSFNSKKQTSLHQLYSVYQRICLMKSQLEAEENSFKDELQKVNRLEMLEFMERAMNPLLHSLRNFIHDFSEMASSISISLNKIPITDIHPVNVNELSDAISGAQEVLKTILQTQDSHFKNWTLIAHAMTQLSTIIQDESLELIQLSQMLQAMSTLGVHERSLAVHSLEMCQDEPSKLT